MNVFPLTVLPTSMTLLQNRLFKQRRCAHSNRSSIIIGCIHVIPVHSSKSPLLSTAAARRPSLVTDPGAAGTSLVPWPNPRTLLLCVGSKCTQGHVLLWQAGVHVGQRLGRTAFYGIRRFLKKEIRWRSTLDAQGPSFTSAFTFSVNNVMFPLLGFQVAVASWNPFFRKQRPSLVCDCVAFRIVEARCTHRRMLSWQRMVFKTLPTPAPSVDLVGKRAMPLSILRKPQV